MLCILCMTNSKQAIDIFDEDGIRLNISSIIGQHFPIEPSTSDADDQVICSSCWDGLDSFHRFYEKVKEAHNTSLNVELDAQEVKEEIPSLTDDLDARHVDLLVTGIKVENREDSEDNPRNVDIETNVNPVEVVERTNETVQDIKYDSESDISVSKLAEHGESSKGNKSTESDTVSISKKRSRKRDVCNTDPKEPKTKKQMQAASSWETKVINDKIIKQNMKLLCDICQASLDNFSDLQEHFQSVHNKRCYAVCCDRKFSKRSVLVDHLLWHKNPEHFKCDQCEKLLTSRAGLCDHKRVMHNVKFIFKCDKCNKNFLRKQLLDRHMEQHIVDRKFQCDQCEKFFTSKFMQGQHIYRVHKKRVCEECGKIMRGYQAFRDHMLDHTNKSKSIFNCGKCGVKLKNLKNLQSHMRCTHSELKATHVCHLCETVATTKRALKRHVAYMHNNKSMPNM